MYVGLMDSVLVFLLCFFLRILTCSKRATPTITATRRNSRDPAAAAPIIAIVVCSFWSEAVTFGVGVKFSVGTVRSVYYIPVWKVGHSS